MELNAARIFVWDMDAARRFYAERLGFTLKHDGSQYGYCVFAAGSADLVVETVAAEAPNDDKALVGRFTGLSFSVRDVQARCQELVAQGVVFTGLPEKQAWGGILATFVDPSGNELQLVQQPA